jgi:DNA-binding NtrC family response regulator
METGPVPPKKTVVLVSADAILRQRLNTCLSGLRWNVLEAQGGAQALAELEQQSAEALLLDAWLPDLDVAELSVQIHDLYPDLDVLRFDGHPIHGSARSPRRHELLYAIGQAPTGPDREGISPIASMSGVAAWPEQHAPAAVLEVLDPSAMKRRPASPRATSVSMVKLDELVGHSPEMLEVAHLIRLVAPRSTTVLIEGETGTGKELVARAVHRLSRRAAKPLVILNCAAIPEALLEAELFGHTRGSFTGAVQSRTGRIEAANGGTLFLDEIGEMAAPLQAKMLRFLASGELQRVGDNEPIRVDVRVIAATHQHLERRAAEGTFRLDLYHRLSVFPIHVAPLRDRRGDIPELAEHFLSMLGRTAPRKVLSSSALQMLESHDWPGNVRELGHVLERASILAEDAPVIEREHIRLRREARR